MGTSLSEIANCVKGDVIGDARLKVITLSSIENILPHSLVFADGPENIKRAEQSDATAILVAKSVKEVSKPTIQVDNPTHAFIQLLSFFYPEKKAQPGIHPTAVIASDVKLGANASIGPYVVIESGSIIGDNVTLKSHVHIGEHVIIGNNSVLHPQVTVYAQCQIGQNVTIHASSVIGSDGFGYIQEQGQHIKIPHVGTVLIEDDVEIGANTVVDRATLDKTVIGQGTKIDNLVQIAHSVKLGRHNILCAFTGIAGSSTSGDNVIFAANVGVSDHVRIDDNVILGARTGVPPKKHLKKGNIYLGNPARPKDKAIEQELSRTFIPSMRKNLKALSVQVAQLSKQLKEQDKE